MTSERSEHPVAAGNDRGRGPEWSPGLQAYEQWLLDMLAAPQAPAARDAYLTALTMLRLIMKGTHPS